MSGQGGITTIDVTEAARRLEDASGRGPLLVDVRERSEFEALRAPGAVLVPMSELQARYRELPQDRPLLVVCARGGRSLVATEFLSRNGFGDVANVGGGMTDWQARGLPTREGAVDPGEGAVPA